MANLSYLDIADQLEQTPISLQQLLKCVDDDLAQKRESDTSWCINEVIGHLIWTDHHAFTERIRVMTEGTTEALPPLDIHEAATERSDHLKTLQTVLSEFKEARASHVDFVRCLDPATLGKSAVYKDRTWLASDFLYEWPFHDYGHMTQILKILRANLVPYMSETMRKAVGY